MRGGAHLVGLFSRSIQSGTTQQEFLITAAMLGEGQGEGQGAYQLLVS